MKSLITIFAMLFFTAFTYAQNTYKAIIKDAKTQESLPGATVKVQNTELITLSDANGLVTLTNVPSGKQVIEYTYVGYSRKTITLTFPIDNTDPLLVMMEEADEHEELEEVVVSATRSTRTIYNTPT